MSKPNLYVVCGYRQTGKDTLYQQMNGIQPFNWIVYPNNNFKLNPCIRISFADQVKLQIWKLLFKVDNKNAVSDIEPFKDKPIKEFLIYYQAPEDIINKFNQTITLRDVIIKYAMDRRKEDPLCWAKSATSNLSILNNYMITDWRFPNEIEYIKQYFSTYFNIVTIRVFRASVARPINEISVNSLDHYLTNYLLVDNQESLIQALQLFPQYKF